MMETTIQQQPKPLITLTEGEQKVLKVAGFAVGTALLGWLGFLIVRGQIRKANDRKESRKSLDKDDPSSYASRLFKAMDGMGTTEESIRAVFREFNSWEQYREVARSYERKYGSILENDLEDELMETEFDEIMEIVNELKLPKDRITQAHLKAWSKRLRSAWDLTCWWFPCTDEDAAYSVLKDIKRTVDPRGALLSLERFYQREHSIGLQDEAESEMGGDDLETWNKLRNNILNSRTA